MSDRPPFPTGIEQRIRIRSRRGGGGWGWGVANTIHYVDAEHVSPTDMVVALCGKRGRADTSLATSSAPVCRTCEKIEGTR